MTPPPTTARDFGMRSRSRIRSESSTSGSSNGRPRGGEARSRSRRGPRRPRAAGSRRPSSSKTPIVPGRGSAPARIDRDPVALEVALICRVLRRRHVAEPAGQLPEALLPIQAQRHAVELAPTEPGQVESRSRAASSTAASRCGREAPPGSGSRSTSATLLPKYAACAAPFSPAGPEPITTRSKRSTRLAGPRSWIP